MKAERTRRPRRCLALAIAPLVAGIWLGLASPAHAAGVQPDEILDDPVLEQRARDLGRELRCVTCENQPIGESNAPLARDLRILVRQRLDAGDTDDEVKDYLRARYGDYVLYRPPFQPSTYVLWLGPVGILAVAAAGIAIATVRRRRQLSNAALSGAGEDGTTPGPLTEAERRRLEAMLKDE